MASKRAQRRRACGKQQFADQTAAGAAVAAARHRGHRLTPYRCGFCGQWHIGHPPAGVRQAMAARRKARDR